MCGCYWAWSVWLKWLTMLTNILWDYLILSCEPLDLIFFVLSFLPCEIADCFLAVNTHLFAFQQPLQCKILLCCSLQGAPAEFCKWCCSSVAVGSGCTAVHMLKATKRLLWESLLQMLIQTLHSTESLRVIFFVLFSSCIVTFFFRWL